MSVFKEVWTCSGFNDRWQEVWYKNGNSIDSVSPVDPTLITLRLAFLGQPFNVEKIRISQVDKPRVTSLQSVNRGGLAASSSGTFASSGDTVVYGLGSVIIDARRRMNIRGLPDSYYFGRKTSFPVGGTTTTLDNKVKDFIVALGGLGYIIYSRFRPDEGIDKPIRVLRVDGSAADGTSILTLAAPFVVSQPKRVRLRQFVKKNMPGLNGSYDVLSLVGTALKVGYSTPENQNLMAVKGTAGEEKFHDTGVLSALKNKFLFVGSRQVKNVAIGSRGAQRAQRTRSQV